MRLAASLLLACAAGLAGAQAASEGSAPKIPEPKLPIPILPAGPLLTAKASLVMEEETGRIIWSKNPDVRRFPASTTKMATAMVLLERTMPDDVVTVTEAVSTVGGSRLGLKKGMKLKVRDLVKAIMILSANDACVAAAVHVSGSVAEFAKLMNETAAQLGAVNTQFKNPHGLHDPLHYSTARDLALIGQAAIRYPLIRDMAVLPKVEVSIIGEPPRVIRNRNILAGVDPTNRGIKTGWTNPAGRCLVGLHENAGMRVVTVVLGCDKAWSPDQVNLMAWFWENFESRELVRQGEAVGQIEVEGALGGPHSITASQDVGGIVPKNLGEPRLVLAQGLKAPLPAGTKVGTFEWPNGLSTPVVLASEVRSQLQALGLAGAVTAVLGGCMVGVWWWRKR